MAATLSAIARNSSHDAYCVCLAILQRTCAPIDPVSSGSADRGDHAAVLRVADPTLAIPHQRTRRRTQTLDQDNQLANRSYLTSEGINTADNSRE